jgi:hypothetical protein
LREMKRLGGWFNPVASELVTRATRSSNVSFQDPLEEEPPAEPGAFAEIPAAQTGRESASIMIDRQEFPLSDIAFLHEDAPMDADNAEKDRAPSKGFTPDQVESMEEPRTFNAAWNHDDFEQREKWRQAIQKEFNDMNTRKVWTKIKRSTMPKGRRCVKHKWVFKIKRTGAFRARLVACGYSQIPGVDFTENYAPVISDVTYRIMIICGIVWKLQSKIIDVETAFLHGDLEEEIYMDCPQGLEHEPDECVLLQRTIYGLVQSARQFFKKLMACLKSIGFKGGIADPCLLTRHCAKGLVIMATYVDDCFCCGHEEAILETIELMKESGFGVTVEDDLTDYLSCNIVFNKERTKAWLGQPHLIKNLEKKYGQLVAKSTIFKTPGTPGQGISRPGKDEHGSIVGENDHKLYRSGVGMLLYLVKHSRPDIANVVRELSKVLDGPTEAAMKELKRAIKFVLATRNYGLKIEPDASQGEGDWEMKIFTDSEYAGDKNTRISVGGYIIFLLGVAILWKSKAQKSVTLSSAEAEFVALSEAAKEIKFVVMILESLGIRVKLPIVVRVDNVGAIFMSENVSTSSRTRHVDIRYHYVREFVEDGFIKIIFVKSEENLSDGFTKNITGTLYDAHTREFMAEREALLNGAG